MSNFKSQVKTILENFETTNQEQIVSVLQQIKSELRSNITQEYLDGKISKILQTNNEKEKSELLNSLKPYLDWYLQGN